MAFSSSRIATSFSRWRISNLFELHLKTRLVFGEGAIGRLGELARELGFRRTLLVADCGLVAAGHVGEAARLLSGSGIDSIQFHDFAANPDSDMIEAGRVFAATASIDSIVGLGGGSS